jgi:hypothetical protein
VILFRGRVPAASSRHHILTSSSSLGVGGDNRIVVMGFPLLVLPATLALVIHRVAATQQGSPSSEQAKNKGSRLFVHVSVMS